jgi:hypothetical protein
MEYMASKSGEKTIKCGATTLPSTRLFRYILEKTFHRIHSIIQEADTL